MTGTILRLLNFIIDSAIYFSILTVFIISLKNVINIENIKWISAILYFSYYFLFEFYKGKTIGKMITKTKVVHLSDKNDYHFLKIFIRTLMRLFPLDIISYLFTERGLHDRVSMTSTVKY